MFGTVLVLSVVSVIVLAGISFLFVSKPYNDLEYLKKDIRTVNAYEDYLITTRNNLN